MVSQTVAGFEVIIEDGKHLSAEQINQYDFRYFDNDENGLKYRLSSIVSVKVFENGEQVKSALIGGIAGRSEIFKNSVIFENKRVIICSSNIVFCLAIPSLTLLWSTESDFAVCFEIFPYKDNYIVHGEVEISRLDHDGTIVWQQSGADIFTTIEGNDDDFTINEEYIAVTDFEYRKYKFDFDGNILES